MTSALSIFAAARDCAHAPGLRVGEDEWSFAELAQLTRRRLDALAREAGGGRPHAMTGSNTLETVVTLYALWECGIAPLLLHPRLTDPERATLLAAAAQAGGIEVPGAAAVLYTSGTTGMARAAILTVGAFQASAAASEANLGWRSDDCWLLCMPLAHVGGLSILTRCLIARRCVALAAAFDVERLPAQLQAQRVSLLSLVPTMLARLLALRPRWRPEARLRSVLLGGAPASSALLQRAFERHVPVLVTYGLTETCSQVTTTPYGSRYAPGGHGVGKPLPGIDVRVRDGHIEVRGPVLMAGYWNEPPLPQGAWLATGDLGTLDSEGYLHVNARRQDLIVTGGENVYPVEVEHALEACPGIAAAGVFGVPDEIWGETVAAALVAGRSIVSDARLQEYLATHLAPHKRPRHVCFVAQLPQTRAGKLDRAALRELARELRPLGVVPGR